MNQLQYNWRNPSKLLYVWTPQHGNFEVPKTKDTMNVNKLADNYQQRLDFEKYLNPKGLKPTITSRFKKPPVEQEYLSHEIMLMRSPKPYEKNQICFRVAPHLSKPEIKQYLMKVYRLPVIKVDTFNKMGKIKVNNKNNTKWRKPDWKKAIVTLDYEVDSEYRHFNY